MQKNENVFRKDVHKVTFEKGRICEGRPGAISLPAIIHSRRRRMGRKEARRERRARVGAEAGAEERGGRRGGELQSAGVTYMQTGRWLHCAAPCVYV